MRAGAATVAFVALVTTTAACAAATEAVTREPASADSGGDTTVFDETRDAFSYSARNMGPVERDTFLAGKSLFQRPWVRAPASTAGGDGLGPTYTATACTACHVRHGRGAVPENANARALGLVAKLARTDGLDPTYGAVLQPFAIDGVMAEGTVSVTFEESVVPLGDGTRVTLKKPRAHVEALAFGPLAAGTSVDLRLAPQLVGLGLLEAIPENTLRAHVDAEDADGDGVRGELVVVRSPSLGRDAIGRFGWRSESATVRDFVAGAFAEDIGITSELHPSEGCPGPQDACRATPHGGTPELTTDKLDKVTFFAKTLAVPARRSLGDALALRGESAFDAMGCATCHVPRTLTGKSTIAALSEQTIFPYTDLLLHDMGRGLGGDDGRTKTRTPPLWGLGLHGTVNGHTRFLHDGRAGSTLEAVLWHGGEGEPARRAFVMASANDRAALLRFLETL